MEYKIIIQANMHCPDNEIIGAKEALSEALELMGCSVEYINVMPGGWKTMPKYCDCDGERKDGAE